MKFFPIRLSRKTFLSLLIGNLFFTLQVQSIPKPASSLIRYNPKELVDQVWQIVYRDYLDSSGEYDESNWIRLRKEYLSKKYIDSSESYQAIRLLLENLKDPYTRFMDPKEFKELRIDTSGELTGVGIQLSVDESSKEVIVVSPIEGTPASRAGIKSKDVIISINDNSTKGMNIEDVVRLIRGKKGTSVKLGIRRVNQFLKFKLIRERIEIQVVHSQLNRTSSGEDIGYIRLKQFNANASREMRQAIKKLESKNVSGYVLDLRSNPGGLLEASIDIARQWLNKGIIVSTQTRSGIRDIRRANGMALTNRPVVVLVNEGSASASEILSGAIQDNNRGLLVGNKTFGKGLVQSVRTLSDGSGLTVTIAKYLTPNGTDIHKNGIVPNIVTNIKESRRMNLVFEDIGSSNDMEYVIAEKALLDRLIKSLKSKDVNNFKPNRVALKYVF